MEKSNRNNLGKQLNKCIRLGYKNQREFCRTSGLTEKYVSEVINNKSIPLSVKKAETLGNHTDICAKKWLELWISDYE